MLQCKPHTCRLRRGVGTIVWQIFKKFEVSHTVFNQSVHVSCKLFFLTAFNFISWINLVLQSRRNALLKYRRNVNRCIKFNLTSEFDPFLPILNETISKAHTLSLESLQHHCNVKLICTITFVEWPIKQECHQWKHGMKFSNAVSNDP